MSDDEGWHPLDLVVEQKKRITELEAENKRLEAEISSLRRERDDALRVAEIVRQLATPPISDADVERAVAEARRVRPQIEGERT